MVFAGEQQGYGARDDLVGQEREAVVWTKRAELAVSKRGAFGDLPRKRHSDQREDAQTGGELERIKDAPRARGPETP